MAKTKRIVFGRDGWEWADLTTAQKRRAVVYLKKDFGDIICVECGVRQDWLMQRK